MFQTNHNLVDLSILDRSPGALSFHLPLHRLATDLPPQALAGTLPKKTWENTQNLLGKDGNGKTGMGTLWWENGDWAQGNSETWELNNEVIGFKRCYQGKNDLTQQNMQINSSCAVMNMQINSSCAVMSIAIVPTWLDYHLGADDNWLIESVPWGAVQ